MKKTILSLFIVSTVITSAFALTLSTYDITVDGPLPQVFDINGDFLWMIDENTQGTNMSPSTYYNNGDTIGNTNGKWLTEGRKFLYKGPAYAGYTVIADVPVPPDAILTVHPSGWTPYASPIDAYVASSTVNADFELLTGFNMVGTSQWIGNYLIKDFIGNLFSFFYSFRDWIIVLLIMGGVLHLMSKAFSFYRH